MERIADRIKKARIAANLKKIEISRRVGVSAPTVSDWESGKIKSIEGENLMRLSRVLGVSPEWLLTGRDGGNLAPLEHPSPPDQASNDESPSSPQEIALLELFRGLTDKQKTEIVQTLEAQKQQNKIAWEELSKVMGKK
ncbi:helix-turn-helix domain-containing protein [Thiothrix winogradskyi]|uniref:Helix-turn-helix domain-containing protein n=1 Tax=Thiothrix winogradskyi TaxID=96472 RepID=A0ABY3T5X8_9GAMM|nr:helix-turn-helix domain-containing protein [Thiothrix winogradskyi]UJS26255.1 helix-turn-helix domain-containing protein [Thiothrix winogradskyi]